MILYRARTIGSRPRRKTVFEGNSPEVRVKGRWFSSDLSSVIEHRRRLEGDTEIIMVDVPDAIAESFRVARTPHTQCGLDPIRHSAQPMTDYILPMFRVMQAEGVAIAGTDRVRDYIDVTASRVARQVTIIEPPMELQMAA